MADPSNIPISRATMKQTKQLLWYSAARKASNPSTCVLVETPPRRNDGDNRLFPPNCSAPMEKAEQNRTIGARSLDQENHVVNDPVA